MKNVLRRVVAIAVVLTVGLCCTIPVSAETFTCTISVHTYEYSLDANGNATIESVRSDDWGYNPGTIPDTLDGHTVVALADNAFAAMSFPFSTQLQFPSTITSMGDNVFGACTNLLAVYYQGTEGQLAELKENSGEQNEKFFKKAVYFVENGFLYNHSNGYAELMTYRGAEGETELHIPASLYGYEVVGITDTGMHFEEVFLEHKNFEVVTFPDTMDYIARAAFQGLPIKEVTLPPNMTSVAKNCFANCKQLEKATIPDSFYKLENLFSGCDALRDIYYEGTQTEWERYAIAAAMAERPDVTVHFGEESGQAGDYDDNGDIDMNDALKLYQGAAGNMALNAIFSAMDVNNDSVVNMLDALMLYRMVS